MKSFEFSLQTLLDSKEALEQLSEIRMGEAMRRLQTSKDNLKHMHMKLKDQVLHAEKFQGVKVDSTDLADHSRHMTWLQQQIDKKLRHVAALERNADKIREQLLAIMREIKSMERLKHKQKTRWISEKNRMEQAEMDEIALRKHVKAH